MRARPRLIIEGDATQAVRWVGWAKKKLRELRARKGDGLKIKAQERHKPDGTTEITVELNPDRIYIKAGGRMASLWGHIGASIYEPLEDSVMLIGGKAVVAWSPQSEYEKAIRIVASQTPLNAPLLWSMLNARHFGAAYLTNDEKIYIDNRYLGADPATKPESEGPINLPGIYELLLPYFREFKHDDFDFSSLDELPGGTTTFPPAYPIAVPSFRGGVVTIDEEHPAPPVTQYTTTLTQWLIGQPSTTPIGNQDVTVSAVYRKMISVSKIFISESSPGSGIFVWGIESVDVEEQHYERIFKRTADGLEFVADQQLGIGDVVAVHNVSQAGPWNITATAIVPAALRGAAFEYPMARGWREWRHSPPVEYIDDYDSPGGLDNFSWVKAQSYDASAASVNSWNDFPPYTINDYTDPITNIRYTITADGDYGGELKLIDSEHNELFSYVTKQQMPRRPGESYLTTSFFFATVTSVAASVSVLTTSSPSGPVPWTPRIPGPSKVINSPVQFANDGQRFTLSYTAQEIVELQLLSGVKETIVTVYNPRNGAFLCALLVSRIERKDGGNTVIKYYDEERSAWISSAQLLDEENYNPEGDKTLKRLAMEHFTILYNTGIPPEALLGMQGSYLNNFLIF